MLHFEWELLELNASKIEVAPSVMSVGVCPTPCRGKMTRLGYCMAFAFSRHNQER